MRFQNKVALIVFLYHGNSDVISIFTDIQTKKGSRKKAPVKIFRERIFCRLLIILLSRDTSGARFFAKAQVFVLSSYLERKKEHRIPMPVNLKLGSLTSLCLPWGPEFWLLQSPM